MRASGSKALSRKGASAGTPESSGETLTKKMLKLKVKPFKKCSRCGGVKKSEEFGSNTSSPDGRQSYCNDCKKGVARKRRETNVPMKLKHHIATRSTAQLGRLTPPDITANLEQYLGYRVIELSMALEKELQSREGPTRSLRDALNEGYHVDHIHPLMTYKVIREGMVDWPVYRDCWRISNLRAIPAAENLAKGAKISETV